MARTRQCPECDAPVRLNKRCSAECHAVVNPRAPEDPMVRVREETSFRTMLLLGLAGMAFFFSFGFFLPAVLAEPGFIWVSAALFAVGTALSIAAWVVRSRAKRRIVRLEEAMHVKCDYCGGINDRDHHQCMFCGVPLEEPPVRVISS